MFAMVREVGVWGLEVDGQVGGTAHRGPCWRYIWDNGLFQERTPQSPPSLPSWQYQLRVGDPARAVDPSRSQDKTWTPCSPSGKSSSYGVYESDVPSHVVRQGGDLGTDFLQTLCTASVLGGRVALHRLAWSSGLRIHLGAAHCRYCTLHLKKASDGTGKGAKEG
jgi:hypothetical protein